VFFLPTSYRQNGRGPMSPRPSAWGNIPKGIRSAHCPFFIQDNPKCFVSIFWHGWTIFPLSAPLAPFSISAIFFIFSTIYVVRPRAHISLSSGHFHPSQIPCPRDSAASKPLAGRAAPPLAKYRSLLPFLLPPPIPGRSHMLLIIFLLVRQGDVQSLVSPPFSCCF